MPLVKRLANFKKEGQQVFANIARFGYTFMIRIAIQLRNVFKKYTSFSASEAPRAAKNKILSNGPIICVGTGRAAEIKSSISQQRHLLFDRNVSNR